MCLLKEGRYVCKRTFCKKRPFKYDVSQPLARIAQMCAVRPQVRSCLLYHHRKKQTSWEHVGVNLDLVDPDDEDPVRAHYQFAPTKLHRPPDSG